MSEQPKRSLLSENEKPAAPAASGKQGSSFMQAMQDNSFMETMKDSQPEKNKYDEMLEQLDIEEEQAKSASAAAGGSGKDKGGDAGKKEKLSRREKKKKAEKEAERNPFEPIEHEDTSEVSQRLKTARKRREKQMIVIAPAIFICVVLNIIAWNNSSFSRGYMEDFFPYISTPYAWIMDKIPFSFGELLILAGLWTVAITLPIFIILMIVKRRSRDFKRTLKRLYGYFYAWILTFALVTETLNCFVLYHCTDFAHLNGISSGEHTHAELEELGAVLTAKINALSTQVQRDSEGHFILTADTNETARKSVEALGKEFKNFDGFTVRPKPIYFSFFMSQMDLMGIYFPFSMEANYNNDMYKAKLLNTVCHELAHTKGFIREDEANFIAFMACSRSENVEYRYSGYLAALTQVRGKIFDYADEETKIAFDSAISDLVWADIDGNSAYWRSVDEAEDTVFDSDTVGEISQKALETNLQMNGIEDGTQSYGRMVDLMLGYYADKGDI